MNRILLCWGCLMTMFLARLSGSEATFSADGEKLWVIPVFETEFLWEIDTASWEAIKRPVSGLAAEESMQALCVDDKGNLLVATDRAVLILPEGKSKPVRLAILPKPAMVTGMSCVTQKGPVPVGTVFVAVRPETVEDETLYAMKPDSKKLLSVFVRRLSDLTTVPQFSDSGRMVFGGNWDLWEGFYEIWEEEDNEKAGALGGSRFAPLALLNTDSANSGSMGVDDVVLLGDDAYAALGGRHMGALIKVPLPAENRYADQEGVHPELAESFIIIKEALEKAVIIEEVERIDALAVQRAADGGSNLFYRSQGGNGFEWKFLVPGKKAKVVGSESNP